MHDILAVEIAIRTHRRLNRFPVGVVAHALGQHVDVIVRLGSPPGAAPEDKAVVVGAFGTAGAVGILGLIFFGHLTRHATATWAGCRVA